MILIDLVSAFRCRWDRDRGGMEGERLKRETNKVDVDYPELMLQNNKKKAREYLRVSAVN
jgi:hypothetical protein